MEGIVDTIGTFFFTIAIPNRYSGDFNKKVPIINRWVMHKILIFQRNNTSQKILSPHA